MSSSLILPSVEPSLAPSLYMIGEISFKHAKLILAQMLMIEVDIEVDLPNVCIHNVGVLLWGTGVPMAYRWPSRGMLIRGVASMPDSPDGRDVTDSL